MDMESKDLLNHWDFPDVTKVEINDVLQDIPELTEENFWTLVDDYNKLIKCFNDTVYTLNKEIKELKSR